MKEMRMAAFMLMILTMLMAFMSGWAFCLGEMRAAYCTAAAGIVSGVAAGLADSVKEKRR